jgi:hypothetical protein
MLVMSVSHASDNYEVAGAQPVSSHLSRRKGEACLSTTRHYVAARQEGREAGRSSAAPRSTSANPGRLPRPGGRRARQGSCHGRATVTARPPAGRRAEPAAAPRPAAQWAVRVLLCDGQAPTPAAVLARVAQRDQHERGMVTRAQAIAQRLSDGPAVAALVARQWEAERYGPTWHELGHRLGWPYRQVGRSVRALAAVGWLTPGTAPRSLRPGPRFGLDRAPAPAALHHG